MLLGSYLLTTDDLTGEALDYFSKVPSLMHCSAMILRLNNDLGTSSVSSQAFLERNSLLYTSNITVAPILFNPYL